MELVATTPTFTVAGHGLVGVLDLDLNRWLPPLVADGQRGVVLFRDSLGTEAFAPNVTVELRPNDAPLATTDDFAVPTSMPIAQTGSFTDSPMDHQPASDQSSANGSRLSIALWGTHTVVQLERWVRAEGRAGLLWLVCSALDHQWIGVADDFDQIANSARLVAATEGTRS